MKLSKIEARLQVSEVRRQLPAFNSSDHCRPLAEFLDAMVPAGHQVVIFDAMAGEVDLQPLVRDHPDPQQRYVITRTPEDGFALTLHRYGGPMERHRFGYQQPVATSAQVSAETIGAVLVPSLAFDASGRRLGRGKGYYDRLLSRLPNTALLVGVTGDFVVEEVPVEDHDVTMNYLAGTFGVLPTPVSDQLITHRILGDCP